MNIITVLITVSNRKYLNDVFISIKNQIYKNFDLLIVVDIHNDEKLYEYVTGLVERYFYNEKLCITVKMVYGNGTAAFVRNRGFELAETEWVTYDDDVITPDAIFEINKAIMNNGDGFYATGYYLFDDKGRRVNFKPSIIRRLDLGLHYGEPHSVMRREMTSQMQIIKKSQWENTSMLKIHKKISIL